jgi:hypothetical protein
MTTTAAVQDDPRLPVELLLRDLRAAPDGLSGREAARRLVWGTDELWRERRRRRANGGTSDPAPRAADAFGWT